MRAGNRESPASPQCAGGGVRREFRALPALSARCQDDRPGPRGRRTLTALARGLSQQGQGFPVARESKREKPRTARMRRPPPDPPALWARESSPAALRTGGGAGKPAQTGVGFAEAWAGEGASVGSSPGSRSPRRLGNRARGPQCGGGGSLGETEWFCACVGLRACGRGSPSCSWGRSIGGGGVGG